MKQLDKRAVWLLFFNSLFGAFLYAFFFLIWGTLILSDIFMTKDGYFMPANFIFMIAGVVVIFVALAFMWAKLSYHYYRYELTDMGFRKESGVIWKKYVTIPYARIQNVDINRGVMARLLGLSDLMIQTAGSSAVMTQYNFSGVSAEGRLLGVSKEDAETLRDELVRRASGSHASGV